jgi:hypothetical protein
VRDRNCTPALRLGYSGMRLVEKPRMCMLERVLSISPICVILKMTLEPLVHPLAASHEEREGNT